MSEKIIYPWQRFWVARDGHIDLSDDGFLLDPESEAAKFSTQRLYTLSDIKNLRALVLLGEPGIGKSEALKKEYENHRHNGGDSVLYQRVDLRAFSTDAHLYNRVFCNSEFAVWQAGNNNLELYFDSLDEALLRIDTVANILADELPNFPTDRMSVCIACRTFAWPHLLESAFRRIWGEEHVGVFELAPLRRKDVREAVALQGINPDEFIEELRRCNAVPFAIKPLTLDLLIRLYKRDRSLPIGPSRLYEEGCLSLCEEQNPSRLGARQVGNLSARRRYRLAARLAAVTMLANRFAISTGPLTQGYPPEDVHLTTLATGRELENGQAFEVTDTDLREVLDTGLFSSRGAERTGWAHHSYAEFLAADYLVTSNASPENIVKVLCHPSGGPVPQLSMIAAWVTSNSQPLRWLLIAQDPMMLLRGDLSGWPDSDLAELTRALLEALEAQTAHDFVGGISREYRKLLQPGIADQLRPYLTDRHRFVVARRAAFMIARACSLAELQTEILAVALDPDDDPSVRTYAVSAIENCGDANCRLALIPVAKGELGPDPNNELQGRALEMVWPQYLPAGELFDVLVPPPENFYGSYVQFITKELPSTLQRRDFIPALAWATAYTRSASLTTAEFHLKHAVDAIIVRAWDHLEDPEILDAFVNYIFTAFHQIYELFLSPLTTDEAKDFLQKVSAHKERRRLILRRVMREPNQRLQNRLYLWTRSGFLQNQDFEWLISLVPPQDDTIDPETLCSMIQATVDIWKPEQYEVLYPVAESWLPLRGRFTALFDGVPLDSQMAADMRQYHQMSQPQPQEPVLVDPPPAERVRLALEAFAGGNVNAWLNITYELTLESTSRFYDDRQRRITTLPGWTTADDSVRQRILDAAERFLESGQSQVHKWLGTTSYYKIDFAACRAFMLLKELRPEAYCRLTSATWKKWAPAITGMLRESNADELPHQESLVDDAAIHAPGEVAQTITKLIRAERRRSRRAGQAPDIAPFYLLRTLGSGVWKVPQVLETVHIELKSRINSSTQFETLLQLLLQAKHEPSEVLAKGVLRSSARRTPARRSFAIAAATQLLQLRTKEAWPDIWAWICDDPAAGSDLFERIGHRFGSELPFFSVLHEEQIGQLYRWLEQTFPYASDSRHQGGGAHWVGPRESVAMLRDAVLRDLVQRGSERGVAVLREVLTALPDRRWLMYQLNEAGQIMRSKTWTPLTPGEVIAVTKSPDVAMIQSPEQLAEVLVRTLRQYELELHGQQNPIRGLWDKQPDDTLRPVEEDALSDHVLLYLKRSLEKSGVVVNREVEVGRTPGAGIGKRTDIKVDAIQMVNGIRSGNIVTAIIETKGCWNRELKTAKETQLVEEYLTKLAAPVGIYLVGWFDKAKWDKSDSRRRQAPQWSKEQAHTELSKNDDFPPFIVNTVILDCSAP